MKTTSIQQNKNTILILGAGLMQKPAILSAKQHGYTVCVADGNANAVCKPLADRFEHIDLKNIDELVKLALSIKEKSTLSGVFTAGTDFSSAVAKIAEVCSLPGHTFEASQNASNKVLMRKCFAEHKVSSPHFVKVDDDSIQNLYEMATKLGPRLYPLVVKPVDNMGGRGCRLVNSFEELKESIEEARKFSRTNCAIVEDYIDGPEFSIDAIIYKNTLTVCGVADRHVFFPPYFIEMGHTMPSSFSSDIIDKLIIEFAKGVASLGLTEGVAKGDIKFGKKGAVIGEIAARLSGGYMSGWTFPYASGFNVTEQALLISCGQEPTELLKKRIPINLSNANNVTCDVDLPFELYTIPISGVSAERAWISIPGKIKDISDFPFISENALRGIKNIFPRSQKGDEVVFPHNNVEKCGNVITFSPEYNDAIKTAEKAVSEIIIRLCPNNKETEDFLNEDLLTEYPPNAFPLPKDILNNFIIISKTEDWEKNAFSVDGQIEIPELFQPYFKSVNDWNYKTMEQVVNEFTSLYENVAYVPRSKFWKYFIRGSIQGLMYCIDSLQDASRLK